MRRVPTKKLAAGAILALVVALGLTTAAPAAPAAEGTLTIRRVDTTDFPNVDVVAMTAPTPSGPDFAVKENGKDVTAQTAAYTAPKGIVLVVDTSGSMAQDGRITAVQTAIRSFVGQLGARDQVAIVGFNNEATVVQGMTHEADKLSSSVERLVPNQETAMWDGVSTGLRLLAQNPDDLQPNIVIITDGRDTVSSTDFATTKANVLSANASVFAVGIQGNELDPAPLQELASTTGGSLQTGTPDAISTELGGVNSIIGGQSEVSYRSTLKDPSSIDLELKVGELSAKAQSIGIGTVTEGVSARPEVVASKTPGLFKGTFAKWMVALLVLAAAGLLAYALILLAVRDASPLDIALQPYAADAAPIDDGGSGDVRMAETALVKRAVEMTGRIAEERGLLQWVERQLEQGDLPLRAAEATFFWLSSIIVFTLLGLFGTRSLFGGLALFFIAAIAPAMVLSGLSGRRKRAFTSQLPDTLQLLSGSLRAGYSLLQGVEAVAQEVDDPMGKELRRVLAEARLGRPLEDSLADTADRMGSPDFEWAVMAIRIQREVGGNLAELLQTVGETMIARERLRREVRALTAEGRISALILGILPVALGFLMYGVNPEYIKTLFHHTSGHIMLGGAGILALIGFYWMKKTIEIEV
jgi:tight adherence protein B